MRRILSMLLALVMVFTAIPWAAMAEETQNDTTVDTGEVTVEGTNGLGRLLSADIQEYQEDTAEEYRGGYTVTDLVIEGNTATVTYDALGEASLVVALYTEDGMQLLTSANTTVTADATEATVTFAGEMPEYFLASAYLVDTYDFSPLCEAYDTPMYTQDMQELLASTVEDYDPNRVLQLTEDTDTNFAVYAEGVILIDGADGVNTVVSADDENLIYVIENADAQITGLNAGDVFAYSYDENEMLIVKVGSISVDGTTVTITGDDSLSIDEAFQAVKIEAGSDTDDIVVDDSTASDKVEYVGLVDESNSEFGTFAKPSGDASTLAIEGGGTINAEHEFKFWDKSENYDDHDSTNLSFSLSGSLKIQLDVTFKYYFSLSSQYVELKLMPSLEYSMTVKGSVTFYEDLGFFYTFPIPGVYVGFNPQIQLKLNCDTTFTAALKFFVVGFKYDTENGFQNISKSPHVECKIKVEGTVFLGIDFRPQVAFLDDGLAEISAKMLVGGELKFSAKGYAYEAYKNDADSHHQCRECLDIDIKLKLEVGGEMKILNQDWLTLKITIGEWTIPLGKAYWSLDNDEFGFGTCPNYTYRITVEVSDKDKKPVEGINVTIDALDAPVTTNGNGVANVYLPAGRAKFYAEKDGYYDSTYIWVNDAKKVILIMWEEIDSGGADGSGGDGDDSEDWRDTIEWGDILGEVDIEDVTDHTKYPMQEYAGHLYQVFDYSMTWHEAKTYCEELGGYLVTITSADEQAFIESILPDPCTKWVYWLGATHESGEWTWISGEDFSYTNWDRAQPDYDTSNGRVEEYLEIYNTSRYVTRYKWNDMYADNDADPLISGPERVGFICEFSWIERIPERAFDECSSLTRISVPDNITSIGNYAFCNCINLTEIRFMGNAPTIGFDAFYNVSATAYYPADNITWTSSVMQNYGGTITWIPYTQDLQTGLTEISTAPITHIEENEETTSPDAVYPGDYVTEVKDNCTLKKATFSGLVPGEQYLLLAMASIDTDTPIAPENLLFIDQAAAGEDGTLTFTYVQRVTTDPSFVVACGAASKTLADATITFPEMVADGELHAVEPTVVYDGATLQEGRDYEITGTVSYTDAGTYVCYIRGIHNYTGTMKCTYTVAEAEEPEVPTDPTDPTDPEAPTDPTDPEEPTDPEKPTNPTDPTDPERPTDPTKPTEPDEPTDPTDPVDPEEPALDGVIRVAGADRIETSLKLADQLKELLGVEKFDSVIVTYSQNFPDALTGSYLAAEKSAPILLTNPSAHARIRAYIWENLVPGGTVYILGGVAAVSDEFTEGLTGFTVKRVAGSDRFETNLKIMEEAGNYAGKPVLIATGMNFADSLSASAAGLPMVLVHGSLRPDQKAFLKTTSRNFVIIGGTAAVSESLEKELKAIGSVERLAGASRYETSVLVAERFVQNPDAVILAYAKNFPDGLCGGPLAYVLGAPLILTDNVSPSAADTYVKNIKSGIIAGGPILISDTTVRAIFDLTADTTISAG